MTYEDSKGPPLVSAAEVDLRLGNCPRTHDLAGGLFMPDRLVLTWKGSELVDCVLFGERLRTDGNPYVLPTRAAVEYPSGTAPEWVRDLIRQHEQRTITATTTVNGG